ncbi:MAG: M48 family metalloprotease [Candidatus Riflebacteria bacterium]|nr:M48 family metalloprotease [Candidatus Riflebacteria bacterium]
MRYKQHLLVLVVCLLFQASFAGQAQALDFGKLLGEVSGALNRVTATVDRAFGGVNEDNQKVLEQSREQAPATNAFLGGWEQSWEVSMGDQTHESLKKDPGFSSDKNLLNRLGTVARGLIKNVERKDLTWTFAVLNTDEVNAFAAPGGHIYVTRGLMKMIENESELAGVVAHEMGHVDKKHSVRQAEKSGLMTALVIGMGLYKKTQKVAPVAAIAAYFANLKFSRDDEYEADSCAVKYMSASGYDPRGLVSFFDKINKDSKTSKVTKYFSTHPPTTDRINAVEKQIAKLPARTTASPGEQMPVIYKPTTTQTTTQTTTYQTSGSKPTNQQLQAAYESYLYYQQQYQYKVQQQAPMNEIMDTFNKYQKAKEYYMSLRKAAGM